MKTKKRTKRSRYRGTHTHGRGAKKKARGKGHRGGVGKAGSGHNADQKKKLTKKKKYFGTVIRRGGRRVNKIEVVDLRKVGDKIEALVKKNIAKKIDGGWEINFSGKKVLCTGEVKEKFVIKAKQASKSALEKVKKAGGNIELEVKINLEKKEKKKKSKC